MYGFVGIAIFCMLLTYYMWIKAVKTGTIYWSTMAALSYFYMVGERKVLVFIVSQNWTKPVIKYCLQVSSWGGYVFLINLIPLHVLVLMFTGRFSHRIYSAYSTLYCVGTLLSMQVSFVGFQPIQTSEHMLVSQFENIERILSNLRRKLQFVFFFVFPPGSGCLWPVPNLFCCWVSQK